VLRATVVVVVVVIVEKVDVAIAPARFGPPASSKLHAARTLPMASEAMEPLQAAILVCGFGRDEAAGMTKAFVVVKSVINSKIGRTETPRARLLVIMFIGVACGVGKVRYEGEEINLLPYLKCNNVHHNNTG